MTPAEKTIWTYYTRPIVIARAEGLCELTGAEGHDVHHILHSGNHPQVALDPRFCILLNKTIHLMDDTGDLVNYLKDHPDVHYYELKREAEARHREPLPVIRARLKAELKSMKGRIYATQI